jgi:hypothetical protein
MIERKRALSAIFAGLGLLIAANVGAEPPNGTPKGDAAHGMPGKPTEAKNERSAPGLAVGKPGSGGADKGQPRGPGAKGAPEDPTARGVEASAGHGKAGENFHREWRELRDELKAGKLKKEDLEGRIAKLRNTTKERQSEHRQALKAHWGDHLAKPEAQQELQVHERRMAKLNRLALLSQTERKGKEAEKLSERVEKLILLETARHDQRMEQITSNGAAATQAEAASPKAVNSAGAK